jgi:hypothetical protein
MPFRKGRRRLLPARTQPPGRARRPGPALGLVTGARIPRDRRVPPTELTRRSCRFMRSARKVVAIKAFRVTPMVTPFFATRSLRTRRSVDVFPSMARPLVEMFGAGPSASLRNAFEARVGDEARQKRWNGMAQENGYSHEPHVRGPHAGLRRMLHLLFGAPTALDGAPRSGSTRASVVRAWVSRRRRPRRGRRRVGALLVNRKAAPQVTTATATRTRDNSQRPNWKNCTVRLPPKYPWATRTASSPEAHSLTVAEARFDGEDAP